MDKVAILCEKDREMMYEFSRRSVRDISVGSFLSVVLSFFSHYMDGNVKKEVNKDRLIIEEAAGAFFSGQPVCDLDLEDIFEKTKKIDQAFLEGLHVPSFSLTVRYSDFADIRIQRIWRIARTVYALLKNWGNGSSFCDVVKNAYTEQEFKDIIMEILNLYNLETRMLGQAIRSPFHSAITSYTEALYRAMEQATEELADAYTRNIFGEQHVCLEQI
jgi:hypothetical protein